MKKKTNRKLFQQESKTYLWTRNYAIESAGNSNSFKKISGVRNNTVTIEKEVQMFYFFKGNLDEAGELIEIEISKQL